MRCLFEIDRRAYVEHVGRVVVCCALFLASCAPIRESPPSPRVEPPASAPTSRERSGRGGSSTVAQVATGVVAARDDRYIVYRAGVGDTHAGIATRFLGTEDRAWEIADLNGIAHPTPGDLLVIPRNPLNPTGARAEGYQTVPILCYHRFGPRSSKMVVAIESFAEQLEFLARNDYRVIPLADLREHLEGKRALPPRAVVITIDDGHVSAYQYAFPLLRKHGFPATIFVYTDFFGGGEALRTGQIQEMLASGVIDVQSHSRTHANLAIRLAGESEQRYRERLDTEIRIPRDILKRQLGVGGEHFAYPYGDANEMVIERLRQSNYRIGVTVNAGANSAFAPPFFLRRNMIFGEHDLAAFKNLVPVLTEVDLR